MTRAKWKGPAIDNKPLNNEIVSKIYIKIIGRNTEILPVFLGKTFKVHNGKIFSQIKITEELIGYKFGEFFPTRKKFSYKKKKK